MILMVFRTRSSTIKSLILRKCTSSTGSRLGKTFNSSNMLGVAETLS
jgi:hypothetical protein